MVVGVRHKEHWNPLVWYILGEVNTGGPSKGGSGLADREERATSAKPGSSVEF